ncbi:protocatechuate 3,4-dioxygenase, partial [Methylobacterium sp. BTF04]|nr:protocatechuate 3,4-dioxygenase [Methylobacterium sp. BTF04]
MKRRAFLLGGAAAASTATVGYTLLPPSAKMLLGNYGILLGRIPILVERDFGWTGADFATGGTKGINTAALPAPIFRHRPNCVTTLANIVGPCDAANVPLRVDVSEGRSGLPMRLSLRVVDAATCRPHAAAEVQLWHADARGIYSGREVSAECTLGDSEALSGLAFRGRQTTNRDGITNFMTVYPGWYDGRSIHVHVRVVVDGREALVSQLFFDDLLSDAIYSTHPDYAGRPIRNTRNDRDLFLPRAYLNEYIFDFEKLD